LRIDTFFACVDKAASSLFKQNLSTQNNGEQRGPFNTQKWFDDGCATKRDQLFYCLNAYRSDNSDQNRENLATDQNINHIYENVDMSSTKMK